MSREFTNSSIDRQNILNNRFALNKIYEYIGFAGMYFDGEYKYTKSMVAEFYGVEERTIDRYLENYKDELKQNGYVLTKGNKLKELMLQFAHVINVGSKLITSFLFEDDYSDELKLELLSAISNAK